MKVDHINRTYAAKPVVSVKHVHGSLWYWFFTAAMLLLVLTHSACKKKETVIVPEVTINSISKNLLNIGDTLVINGSKFSNTKQENLVAVSSISYPVIKASENQLMVVVPQGAQSGALTVSFAQGKATTFSQLITILGATEPVIESVSPASVYENDTIVIKGRNFAVPFNLNSVTFNGSVTGKITNATSTELKVIVPDLTNTGDLQVTTNGLSSLPQKITIAKVNPAEDGRIYWMAPTWGGTRFGEGIIGGTFYRGEDNTVSPPQSSQIYQANTPFWGVNPRFYIDGTFYPERFIDDYDSKNIYNYVVNDKQNNAYYITNNGGYPFPASYSLMKFSQANKFGTPVQVWKKDFTEPVYDKFYGNQQDTIYNPPISIHRTPMQQISMDGNTMYMKLGISDDFYVGDVAASSPTFTLQKNLFGDPLGYAYKFGKDYVFYTRIRAREYEANPGYLSSIRYVKRGSKVSGEIPLDIASFGEVLVCTMADPAHGNILLIVTTKSNGNSQRVNVIYKFDADTKKLSVLYDETNWQDAIARSVDYYLIPSANSGFLWAGQHIYYCNFNGSALYTGLHRIDDKGGKAVIRTVYGRMEPTTANRYKTFNLFLGNK